MHPNRFGAGRLHRRCRCPGLSHRRRPSKVIGTNGEAVDIQDFQQLLRVWLFRMMLICFLSLGYTFILLTDIAHPIVHMVQHVASWLFHYSFQSQTKLIVHPSTMFAKLLKIFMRGVAPLYIAPIQLQSNSTKPSKQMKKRVIMKYLIHELHTLYNLEDSVLNSMLLSYIQKKKKTVINKRCARRRRFRQRKSWASFQSSLTNRQFRRYFRMSKGCFSYLCEQIKSNVGEDKFKSEEFLSKCSRAITFSPKVSNIMRAHEQTTGGFISGEVKLALTLRLLAGGSYMDLALLFETGFTYSYTIFHFVIENWILDDKLVKLNGIDYCMDDDRMKDVALQFHKHSHGVINGCIGAIDGWIVKIVRPSMVRDKVVNPGSYFSRKGFFGINVQAIVDKKKRILYRNIRSRGAEHDSTAFKNSPFYEWIMTNWSALAQKGYYFIGDSAYALKSFLLTPYDNVQHGTDEDNFNFFHSSSRIAVECAFGEIDLRWGILWRPLKFTLQHNCFVIDACMRLHNFIVDYREATTAEDNSYEKSVFDDDSRRFLAVRHDLAEVDGGVHGGELDGRRDANGNQHRGGRPTLADAATSAHGKAWRNEIRDEIKRRKLVRPPTNWYRENNRVLSD